MIANAGNSICYPEPVEESLSFPGRDRVSSFIPHPSSFSSDRRVYKLDLFECPPAEAADTLTRYLARARVESGEALETARKEYCSRNRRSQARAAIPETWRALLDKGNKDLVNMLASAVESRAGVRPDDEDVAEFLAALGKPIIVETASIKPSFEPSPRTEWQAVNQEKQLWRQAA
jgi:hypothetical protein